MPAVRIAERPGALTLVAPVAIPAPDPLDLKWTAEHLRPHYEPLTSWLELDLLLHQLGGAGFPYLVVEHALRQRFAQAWGGAGGMIVELCGSSGMRHPAVFRVRSADGARSAHATLEARLFDDGSVDARDLFSPLEAGAIMRSWLERGSADGFELVPVAY